MKARELREAAGITYRELNHWTRKGYIDAEGGGKQGVRCDWPRPEHVILMARLVRAGMEPARASVFAARLLDAHGPIEIGYGIWLVRAA